MTYPIRNLAEASARFTQYLIEDRPLNLDEMRQVRDMLSLALVNYRVIAAHLAPVRNRLPPAVALALQTLDNVTARPFAPQSMSR